jgi:lysophospholipase L1-like esterase
VACSGRAWCQEAKKVEPKIEDGIAWYNVQDWGVEGKGWSDTKRYYDRFPGKAEGVVRDAVWGLSRHSAGMAARFKTDATTISTRYTLLSKNVAMPHMPATGVSGVDLYARNDAGQLRWLGITRPKEQTFQGQLAGGMEPKLREYMAYLPLYNGVESLEIGVPQGAAFEPLVPRNQKPIVFYGTSILHGGCASRPGMAFPAIVGRRLDRPVINLGFSGNGKMEAEVGQLLAELDAAAYVIDCLPNMAADEVAQRAEPLVRQLRAAHPDAPIVLVEDRTYGDAAFVPQQQQRNATSRAALKDVYARLVADGVKGLAYIEGNQLLGDDDEATVDGSHPSDLGMMRQADVLIPVLRPLVEGR